MQSTWANSLVMFIIVFYKFYKKENYEPIKESIKSFLVFCLNIS